ncbi:MAG: hypothetical protein EKK53_24660 [Burkholderiales bacterium]|nr:MAG: hypothetical protein EKK53_24660 [Burkholderiales bacterium]
MDIANEVPPKAPVVLVWAKAALARFRHKASVPVVDELDFDDIDHMQAWSISCRLAAVPMNYLNQVPPEVASLVRQAKELHPQMAAGAAERDARGEPCPPL